MDRENRQERRERMRREDEHEGCGCLRSALSRHAPTLLSPSPARLHLSRASFRRPCSAESTGAWSTLRAARPACWACGPRAPSPSSTTTTRAPRSTTGPSQRSSCPSATPTSSRTRARPPSSTTTFTRWGGLACVMPYEALWLCMHELCVSVALCVPAPFVCDIHSPPALLVSFSFCFSDRRPMVCARPSSSSPRCAGSTGSTAAPR